MITDPGAWFDGAERVLFVHAHPDDETIASGGTIAALAFAGRTPAVLTLTRGERGEVAPGPFAALQATPGLAPHREMELAAALEALGVAHHLFLGAEGARAAGLDARTYEDSGMVWGDDGLATAAPDASELALTSAPAMEILNDVIQAVHTFEPSALVSYDEIGGYGHPDHVLAHRVTRAVAVALEMPFWQIVEGDAAVPADTDDSGVQTYDITETLPRKLLALRMHGTQLTVVSDHEIEHVGGQRQPVPPHESFQLLPTV